MHYALMNNLHSIDEVYMSTVYGASHKEVRILGMLKDMGSKSAHNQLSRSKINSIWKKIKAMDSVDEFEPIDITVTQKQFQMLQTALRLYLKKVKKVPSLAREQAVISFTSNFEAYISDLLREIFDKNVDVLKSSKSTLKDEELIESLKTGNTLETLKEVKIRDLMYGSVKDWIIFYQKKLGFRITLSNDLVELYLVRNCLIHNGGMVSKELENEIKKSRYKLGRKINVTEKDYNRYKNAIIRISEELWEEFAIKFD